RPSCYPVVQEEDGGSPLPFPDTGDADRMLQTHDSDREHAMSQSAVAALASLPFELVIDDGEPLETDWHDMQHSLLRTLIYEAMGEQARTDFFVAGNMFVYYSREQARQVAEEEAKRLEKKTFRGPDVFWVGGVPPHERQCWI